MTGEPKVTELPPRGSHTLNNHLAHAAVLSCLFLNPAGLAAEGAEDTIVTSHGISAFGDLKYAADFKHFDYVNPDAMNLLG